jgi:hypothetical protein
VIYYPQRLGKASNKKGDHKMMNSIYDYLEDIYYEQGIAAQIAEEDRIWEMYHHDLEAFAAFIEENKIDLHYYTLDNVDSDFEYWCESMEERKG